jgi:hypothetical protein
VQQQHRRERLQRAAVVVGGGDDVDIHGAIAAGPEGLLQQDGAVGAGITEPATPAAVGVHQGLG